MSRGLILGKFMPLHNGHVWAINVAAKLVDDLTVLVCTQADDPIDGALRADWVDKILPANATAYWLAAPMPQKPEDDPDFWEIWRSEIYKRCGTFNKVFGGEPYVVELAKHLNATPVPLGRDTVCISASEIREDPHEHWQHIPSVVRSYYQKRVTLLGPESVGKSTLALHLAQHSYRTHIPEYGRLYDDLLKNGRDWVSSDFHDLAETHRAIRETTALNGGSLVIEDTDAIQTLAWCSQILGVADHDYQIRDTADLYLLLAPDVPWVDDGTRYGEKHRNDMFDFLRGQLVSRELRYALIEGDWNDRIQMARNAIDELLLD